MYHIPGCSHDDGKHGGHARHKDGRDRNVKVRVRNVPRAIVARVLGVLVVHVLLCETQADDAQQRQHDAHDDDRHDADHQAQEPHEDRRVAVVDAAVEALHGATQRVLERLAAGGVVEGDALARERARAVVEARERDARRIVQLRELDNVGA